MDLYGFMGFISGIMGWEWDDGMRMGWWDELFYTTIPTWESIPLTFKWSQRVGGLFLGGCEDMCICPAKTYRPCYDVDNNGALRSECQCDTGFYTQGGPRKKSEPEISRDPNQRYWWYDGWWLFACCVEAIPLFFYLNRWKQMCRMPRGHGLWGRFWWAVLSLCGCGHCEFHGESLPQARWRILCPLATTQLCLQMHRPLVVSWWSSRELRDGLAWHCLRSMWRWLLQASRRALALMELLGERNRNYGPPCCPKHPGAITINSRQAHAISVANLSRAHCFWSSPRWSRRLSSLFSTRLDG